MFLFLLKTDNEFWDFSYDEMIEYDVPAVIDYVLNATKRGKFLIFIFDQPQICKILNFYPRVVAYSFFVFDHF